MEEDAMTRDVEIRPTPKLTGAKSPMKRLAERLKHAIIDQQPQPPQRGKEPTMTSFIAVCTKESGKRPTITKRGLRAVMVACRRSLRHCPSARRMLGLGMLQFKWWGTCSEALHYVRAAKASLEGEPGMAFERGQLVIAEKILQEARSRFLGIELERQPYEPQLVNDNGQPLHAQGLQYNA